MRLNNALFERDFDFFFNDKYLILTDNKCEVMFILIFIWFPTLVSCAQSLDLERVMININRYILMYYIY